jgi:hypothetical protein
MKIDFNKIEDHKQVTPYSCVPMSVELVLKLLGLMAITDFSLQNDPNKSGNSNWIKNGFQYPYVNPIVKFNREFLLGDLGFDKDRGDYFMQNFYNKLFDTIDKELENNRLVIISLESGIKQWHMEVVFDKVSDQEYSTVTFYHNNPQYTIYSKQPLKQRVNAMQGTDILTYKFL